MTDPLPDLSHRLDAIFSHPSALPLLRPWWERARPLLGLADADTADADTADSDTAADFLRDFGRFLIPRPDRIMQTPWADDALGRAYSSTSAAICAVVAGNTVIAPPLVERSEKLTRGVRWFPPPASAPADPA